MKIMVDQEEWWVWAPVEGTPNYGVELDVPPAIARRWRKALADFNKMASEIYELVES